MAHSEYVTILRKRIDIVEERIDIVAKRIDIVAKGAENTDTLLRQSIDTIAQGVRSLDSHLRLRIDFIERNVGSMDVKLDGMKSQFNELKAHEREAEKGRQEIHKLLAGMQKQVEELMSKK